MFYDENNLNPETEGVNNQPVGGENAAPAQETQSAAPSGEYTQPAAGENTAAPTAPAAPAGEYHYTRQTNPGAAPTEQPRAYTPQGSTPPAYDSNYRAFGEADTAPIGGYYQAQRGNAQSSQNGGYMPPRSTYQATSGSYQAPNGGYQAPNGGYQAPNGGYGQSNARRTVPPRPTSNPVPPKPPKKKSSGGAGKLVALALACSLAGGAVGAGGVFALQRAGLGGSGKANVTISERDPGGVSLNTNTVKEGESMTPAQIYKTYADAVVCINVSMSQGTGAGTGFIIDGKEGYVLTCYHVVDGAKSISVTLNDGGQYTATYVGGDKDQDCAILKITPNEGEKLDLKSVVLGDSTKLEVGESVCTIGNALGTLANTLTSGTVSALDRSESMEDGTVMNVLQTDTSINSGNSGGPLFNSYGEVIGIVNAKRSSNAFSNTASVEGIAFAIPISSVTDIMDDLMEHGYVTGRPLLGITLATITQATAQQYPGMVPGAYVRDVSEGSCAEKAGIKVGDIITSFDGKEVTSSAEVIELKRSHKAGDEVEVVVNRSGEDVLMKVVLDEDPDHDNPIDDGSGTQEEQGDQGYGFNYGYGDEDGNGGNGYGFPFSFFGW